jgi:HAD superfamily 5'-nucleotidase-like hydrolase
MRGIAAVGFDMDYTLAQVSHGESCVPAHACCQRMHARTRVLTRLSPVLFRTTQYRPETFEDLAYRQACGKLVANLGYPKEVLSFEYDCHYMVRGLAVDKARGNVLKMDRHKYVKLAFHGFTELPRQQRLAIYADSSIRESYDEPDYALLDTLFSLGETYLFCQLVELKDAQPELFSGLDKKGKAISYAQMHADVRAAVDMCHRDGSLKRVVAADPARYIYPDASLVPLLDMLRASGR